MIQIDAASPVPINDQIKAGLRGLVARGLLKPGDQAPSVRGLAASLKVNPNTVARAFRELSLEGFLESRRGEGNYVSDKAKRQVQQDLECVRADLMEAVRAARRGGLDWRAIETAVKKLQAEDK
ncbi:MAG: GntR family transcriptional regulator [Elusimicrobia bacterium]|nr:GntR family transcriptional regulator [Elusimicrobiota bacterium]